jgi:plasmid maintenance system antidote protein VapI
MTAEFWMGLQSDYELELVRYVSGKKIMASVQPATRSRKTSSLTVGA